MKERRHVSARAFALQVTLCVLLLCLFSVWCAFSFARTPSSAATTCTDNSWTAITPNSAPVARDSHTAVWTGNEMIIWGGAFRTTQLNYFNSGGRYNPVTNSWTPTTLTGAPSARADHTAVWTGDEMIIWGGHGSNTGARYNPSTDSWTAISTSNAPTGRSAHTAVWTGSEMIVWGGSGGVSFNSGGRYNPSTNSWTATSISNAPTGRAHHAAIWTGNEMIVWGGGLNTGGRYNPVTDQWTPTSTVNAPNLQSGKAVWTGEEMIVWGELEGGIHSAGGRYNPTTDSWSPLSAADAPSVRYNHSAIWTGNEMIVWGGQDIGAFYVSFNTGARYNPSADSWRPTDTISAPQHRTLHSAVWTGSEMIVWGGYREDPQVTPTPYDTGARYCAQPPRSELCGTFSNSAPIIVPAVGAGGIASPYPSNITVSGLGGVITKVTVAINGIAHTAPADIDVLLVGPTGQNAIIMSDVGGYAAVDSVDLLLDDAAANSLPKCNRFFCPGGSLVSGTFQPTNNQECDDGTGAIDTFPAPAPIPRGGSPLSLFNGTDPNGTWRLYVLDDEGTQHAGTFSNGWAITISTDSCSGPTPTPSPTPAPLPGPTHFRIQAPSFLPIPAGITFTVTALDASNQTVDYPGVMHFTSSNPSAQLPPDSGLTNGTGTFTANFGEIFIGNTVTATDNSNPHLTGTSNCVVLGDMTPPPPPSPTPSPSPTPLPTGTPLPTPCGVTFSENFDGVTAPSLPTGWVTAAASGISPWQTSTENAPSGPNDAVTYESSAGGETVLETPAIAVPAEGGILSFQNHFNLLGPPGGQATNGMVLDIRINAGSYDDIIGAGGAFLDGGYTHTIGCCVGGNPLTGRMAWSGFSGNSASYITSTIRLPATANGQTIKLKWRVGTIAFPIGGIPPEGEVRIDSIVITPANCPTPTPCPACTPTPTATATPTPSPTPSQSGIMLVSRYSDARAHAHALNDDSPPNQIQTDFLPANLENAAAANAAKGGTGAVAQCVSNSEIVLNQSLGTMQVTGDTNGPGVRANAFVQGASADAGAKLIVLTFTLVDSSFSYSLSGKLSASANCNCSANATAKLTGASSTIFDLATSNGQVTLAEAGTLPPDTYTLSIEATAASSETLLGPAVSHALFTFSVAALPSPTATPTPTPVAHALNLSTRLRVGTGNDVGVGGFIITGSVPKQVLLRGIGPSLGSSGLANPLADPVLELHGPPGFSTVINNNWRETQEAEIILTGISPINDLESGILMTLDPGAYTAILRGNNDGVGGGLVEIYDLSQGTASKLGNLSTRAFAGTGNDIVIAGFILGGGTNDDTVLLRGLGPSLIASGVFNALANPTLELRNSDGAVIAMNDDWQSGPTVSLPPTDPLESAIEMPLSPGAYTALLSGVSNGTGVGLVEVYDLGSP